MLDFRETLWGDGFKEDFSYCVLAGGENGEALGPVAQAGEGIKTKGVQEAEGIRKHRYSEGIRLLGVKKNVAKLKARQGDGEVLELFVSSSPNLILAFPFEAWTTSEDWNFTSWLVL